MPMKRKNLTMHIIFSWRGRDVSVRNYGSIAIMTTSLLLREVERLAKKLQCPVEDIRMRFENDDAPREDVH
jgi:hypothetical protein